MGWVNEAKMKFFSKSPSELSDLIADKAEEFIDSLNNADLRAIAWELLDKNVWWMKKVKTWADPIEGIPIGMAEIIQYGFTSTQMRRLKRLDNTLMECGAV